MFSNSSPLPYFEYTLASVQNWWRIYKPVKEEDGDDADPKVVVGAVLCLQAHWRGCRERERFRLWREAALVLQRPWRSWLRRRHRAALLIQTAWRRHRAREAYLHLHAAVVQLQAGSRGYLARRR